jgi:hypothetical protein
MLFLIRICLDRLYTIIDRRYRPLILTNMFLTNGYDSIFMFTLGGKVSI